LEAGVILRIATSSKLSNGARVAVGCGVVRVGRMMLTGGVGVAGVRGNWVNVAIPIKASITASHPHQ
jgi:hypothetical protein